MQTFGRRPPSPVVTNAADDDIDCEEAPLRTFSPPPERDINFPPTVVPITQSHQKESDADTEENELEEPPRAKKMKRRAPQKKKCAFLAETAASDASSDEDDEEDADASDLDGFIVGDDIED